MGTALFEDKFTQVIEVTMFNILVSGLQDTWETDHVMKMPAERFNKYSGPEADGISLKDRESLKVLETVDTLLMYETGIKGANADTVRVGRVIKITGGSREVSFYFKESGRFPRELAVKHARLLGLESHEFGHTHWAIKDGRLHKSIRDEIVAAQGKYDVALSFAGEDREYVEAVADTLKGKNILVFYDRFEEVDMWGKDLIEHFDYIYRLGAQFCVMFISADYARKVWPRHEKRSALAAALEARQEYVLPARFDDTEIPGLRPTVHYIDLRFKTPEELAEMINRKLGR